MDNSQVTFTVQGHGLKGPVGRPILLLCEALQHVPQQLVWFRAMPNHVQESTRLVVPEGPLTASALRLAQDINEREFYGSVLTWKGIQAEFEVSD